MAQTPKSETEKMTENTQAGAAHLNEQGKHAADQATDVSREMTDNVKNMTHRSVQTMQKTADNLGEVQRNVADRSLSASTELGQVAVDLVKKQADHNIKTLTALYDTIDWEQVVKAVNWKSVAHIQREYLRVSMEYAAQLMQRYFEVSQAAMNSNASIIQRQVKKAA